MRQAFIQGLVELARQDQRVMLLTADLGFMVVEPFATTFPDRFVNVGVAEQNMLGLATGQRKTPDQRTQHHAHGVDQAPVARVEKTVLLKEVSLEQERPRAGKHRAHATDAAGKHKQQRCTGANE